MNYINLAGRLLFSILFVISGISHFSSQTIAFAASQGVLFANILVPASGILALIGAGLIITGYKPKWGAVLILLFLAPITVAMHPFWTVSDPIMYQMQFINFFKNVSMLGGALIIISSAPAAIPVVRRNTFKAVTA
ncbi:DoxX family protein [Desertivirga brevis]|uniref:DoxX family protein n=1 Tax=Desertivirga brevis TaxID=2810310 RepID=UPI001A95C308|nr:DoxX family protein [Pedobacter sp. SYSU D00873]